MRSPTLTDLPPELLDHITSYLPTAWSVANLGASNKRLQTFVEKDGWRTFELSRFPSLCPPSVSDRSPRDVARSLATLSKAWDRRAFVARYVQPSGDITSFPGAKKVKRWKMPVGQTIGFTPQLDVYEDTSSGSWDRKEVLAFAAGAELVLRLRTTVRGREHLRYVTYRPLSSYPGRDDIATIHLIRPGGARKAVPGAQELITGTANGDLWMLRLPDSDSGEVPISYFVTQGLPVRSSSLLQGQQSLLAANIGDSRLSLYPVDSTSSKIAPLSTIDIRPPHIDGQPVKHQRIWSTSFLSRHHLAAGIGPSDEPIQIYSITPSGLEKEPIRKFSLQNDVDRLADEITLSSFSKKKLKSSVYPIVPLPPSSTSEGSSDGQCFLSGAYDGIIRLHDLRSQREVEQAYVDPTDDSAIYSLLPRGRETLVAGTSRHSLLKVFDMRLGSKAYSFLDATQPDKLVKDKSKNWSLFLRPSNSHQQQHGWGRQRGLESSVYSLASPSPSSPYVYAGVENAVLELAFTSITDKHPDCAYFEPWRPARNGEQEVGWKSKEVLDLAMYDQTANMKLCTQRSMWETWRVKQNPVGRTLDFPLLPGMDDRWRVNS